MCGFAGMYGRVEEPTVRAMLEKIRYRGPDDQGLYRDDTACLGHNRLTIIDLESGPQPLANEDETLFLIYNGEVYNFRRLRQSLEDKHKFRTRTDTEVILHAYEEHGVNCVERFDGMFAFVLYDKRRGELFMARDPLGIKPLYYGYGPDGTLYFASEIKALSVATDDIREFPNGHFYHSRLGFQQYFRIPPDQEVIAEADAAVVEIRQALEKAVCKRLIADVPVGVFLSGGLDSSMIAAIASRYKQPLQSFAVGMDGSPDLAAAREVADFLGTDHREYRFTAEQIAEILPRVVYSLESCDPALVRSAVATYFVSRLARRHVKVVLSGEGADELFSGYDYLKELDPDAELNQELLMITGSLHNTNLQRVDRLTMFHSIEGRVPFLDVEMVRLAFRLSPRLKLYGKDKVEKWILRRAAEAYLPPSIIWRAKQKFALGTGTAEILKRISEEAIPDEEFERERWQAGGFELKSKEELYYYRIFRRDFRAPTILRHMGRSRSLDPLERYA